MVMFRVVFKMKLPVLAFALLMAGSAIGADEAALRADAQKVFKEKVGPFVNKYCTRCHGSRAKAGINLQSALKNPDGESASLHWKKAVANVKVHDMPPEDSSKKPTDEERRQFAEWIGKLKYLAPRDPGPFVIRRLTKAEYGNTLRDLYGVSPSVTDILPDEAVGEGYLNSISPLQSELFLEVANKVVGQVMAPAGQAPTAVQKRLLARRRPRARISPRRRGKWRVPWRAMRIGGRLPRRSWTCWWASSSWDRKTSWITWRRWG